MMGSQNFCYLCLFHQLIIVVATLDLAAKCPKQCFCKVVVRCIFDDVAEPIQCPPNWHNISLNIIVETKQKEILDGILNNCSNSSIKAIMLTNTGSLTAISNDFFYQVPMLETFVVKGPGLIEKLSIDLFRYTKHLKKFTMTNNKVKKLEQEVLFYCSNLQQLYLQSNMIQSLTNRQFEKCTNLKIIDLGNNLLTVLNKGTFTGAKSLYMLILSRNNISYIESLTFSGLESIHTIDLSYNSLLNIDVGLFYQVKMLSILLLNSNKISAISIRAFKDLFNLRKLNLRENKIEYLDESIFGEMINLEILELDVDIVCFIKRGDLTIPKNIEHLLSQFKWCFKEPNTFQLTTIGIGRWTEKEVESNYSPLTRINNIFKDGLHGTNISCINCNITLSCKSTEIWISFLAGIMTSAFIILCTIFMIYVIVMQRRIYKMKSYKSNQDAMSLMTTNTRESNLCPPPRSDYKLGNCNHEGDVAV